MGDPVQDLKALIDMMDVIQKSLHDYTEEHAYTPDQIVVHPDTYQKIMKNDNSSYAVSCVSYPVQPNDPVLLFGMQLIVSPYLEPATFILMKSPPTLLSMMQESVVEALPDYAPLAVTLEQPAQESSPEW